MARNPMSAARVPEGLCGSWLRAWIERRPKTPSPQDPPPIQDGSVAVHYVQTPHVFVDLRVAIERPPIRASRLAELTDDELEILARQQGFAGHTSVSGDVVTWHHELDFQPTVDGAPELDVGRIEPHGSALLEHALDGAYSELWWRLSSGDGRFLALAEREGGGEGAPLARVFVLAGDAFMFARRRATPLPPAASLAALLRATGTTRAAREAYLDCEISYGLARGAAHPWQVLRSTLPWREGATIPPPARFRAGALAPDDGWALELDTLHEADAATLFG